MELNIFEAMGYQIVEVISDEIVINNPQDALDLIAEAGVRNADRVIVYEHNLAPVFFDLHTQLAGEILQKFANYRVKIAIIGEFEKFISKSLRAFIVESNRGNLVFFVSERESAVVYLTK